MLNSNTQPTPDLQQQSIDQLVNRAQAGCVDSFAELTERFRPKLTRFIASRLASRQNEAEDVVQEALTKAWQELHRFDPRYKFSTWLYTLSNHLAIDCLRRRRPAADSEKMVHVVDRTNDVQSTASQREEIENLWAAAERELTNSQYSALWLRYGEDFSVREIAQVLSKSSVGVRVLLHRARSVLKKQLLNKRKLPVADPAADRENAPLDLVVRKQA